MMRNVTALGLLLAILVSPAASQPPTVAEQPLVIEGRVLWIDFGSETLVLAPSTGGPAIAIDLHRIGQSDYHGLRGNEYVRVVIAPSISLRRSRGMGGRPHRSRSGRPPSLQKTSTPTVWAPGSPVRSSAVIPGPPSSPTITRSLRCFAIP